MADTFKETEVEGLKLGRPSAGPTEAVRRDEFDDALAAKADAAQVASDLSNVHDPVTVEDTSSVHLTISSIQALQAEVILADAVELQAAESGRTQFFLHPVVATNVLQADRVALLSLVVTRVNSSNGLIATGVLGTDYSVDMLLGRVTILTGSNLVTSSTQKVKLLFDCAQQLSGPGIVKDDGVAMDFGSAHHQVPRGDHRHTNDHKPAAGTSTQSAVVTVDSEQRLKADVRVDSGGGIIINSNGLAANFSVIAAASHSHGLASNSVNGFMSSADWSLLYSLSTTVISVANSNSINLSITAGLISAAINAGAGILVDGTGVKVDPTVVALAAHTHQAVMAVNVINVTNGGSGYTTAPITISGGAAGGHGCAATATIVGGVITKITVTEPGFRYRQSNPPNVIIGGDGTGAAATAVVNENGGFLSKTAALDLLSLL